MKKNPAAVQLGKLRSQKGPSLKDVGRLGGIARKKALPKAERQESARKAGKRSAATLTPEDRSERARKAASARWENKKRGEKKTRRE